jgi:CAAX amino terminal protease family.
MKTNTNKKKELYLLILAICAVFVTLFGVTLFNTHLLKNFSLPLRVVLSFAMQWLLFLAPGFLMLARKERIQDLGFTKKGLGHQILIGLSIAFVMSAFLTVIPILLGFRQMVGSTNFTQAWQFVYEFFYRICGVALAEELIFRGYIFNKLMIIKNNKRLAIIVSSILFGLFHVFNGDLLQILITTFIGVVYCLYRERIKNCTLLSLIVAHGVYGALIVLFVGVL